MSSTRRTQIALLCFMAAALFATVASSYSNVLRVRATLVRGQGDAILDRLRREATPGSEWSDARAADLLHQLQDDGVLCLAVFDDSAQLLAAAGSCAAPTGHLAELLETAPGGIVDLGDRVRMVRRRPRRTGGEDEALLKRLTAAGLPPLRALLIEFQPRLTYRLERSALRTLGIGGGAGLMLLLFAVLFYRQSRRAEQLERQVARDRQLATLGEMAAVLSHEIRNPLASMKGHAQLLAEVLPAGSRERQKADLVVGEAERLEGLSRDLLAFVRSSRIVRTDVDPAAVLRQAAEAAGDGRVDLEVAEAPGSWSLDAGMLHQALTNLLTNAVQASPEGGRVTAEVRQEGDRLVFAVRDRGAGIAAGTEEQIFAPFHTTRVRGTGLGLTVAQRIVELHGGTLTAANHPDGGAVLRATIPANG